MTAAVLLSVGAIPLAIGSSIDSSSLMGECRRCFRSLFSLDRVLVLTLSLAFSACNFLFSASIIASNSSSSLIRCFFLSRAVCAATRFFNFLLINFSSGDRFVNRLLFLVPPTTCMPPEDPDPSLSVPESSTFTFLISRWSTITEVATSPM